MDLLWKRSLNHGLYELCKLIPRERYTKNIVDIMEIWNPFDFNKYISQDEVCKFLGVEGKPEDIDGSMIYDLWHQKEFDKKNVDKILNENKTTDFLKLGKFYFHPGITLAMSETKVKIKKFASGFFVGFK